MDHTNQIGLFFLIAIIQYSICNWQGIYYGKEWFHPKQGWDHSFCFPKRGAITMKYYLEEYKQFETVTDLNNAVSDHLNRCKYEINETDRDVLMMLAQYAVKYAGVAHLKIKTIADKVNKGESTVRRILNKLVKLEIIKKQSFFRKVKGGFGANLFIFLPMNEQSQMSSREGVIEPVAPTIEPIEIENESIKSLNLLSPLSSIQEKASKRAREATTFVTNEQKEIKIMQDFKQYFDKGQRKLYSMMQLRTDILDPRITESLQRIVLRAGKGITMHTIDYAIKAISVMDRALQFGVEIDCLPAYFARLFADRLEYKEYNSSRVNELQPKRDTSMYFDWTADVSEMLA